MKNVLLIHTDGNTYNNPSLVCLIDTLIAQGINITIRGPKTRAPQPAVKGVKYTSYGKFFRLLKKYIQNVICSDKLCNILSYFEYYNLISKFDTIIAVDRVGLIDSFLFAKKNIPIFFFSFEIMFEVETSKKFKQLERRISPLIKWWFIQDEIRGKKLRKENFLSKSNCTFLPLASEGLPVKSKKRLRDRLGVPKNKHCAILIGSLESWTMAAEIIKSVNSWPEDWVLIVNERYGNIKNFIDELSLNGVKLDKNRIYFNKNYNSKRVDKLEFTLSGIDVGIAFYRPDYSSPITGLNLKYLGLASGKISTYLRYGLPVVCNKIGLLSIYIKKYKCGKVVKEPNQICNALVDLSCKKFKKNAINFFSKKLDYKNFENKLIQSLNL